MAHRAIAARAVDKPIGDVRGCDRAGIEDFGKFPDQPAGLGFDGAEAVGFAGEDDLGRAVLGLVDTGGGGGEFIRTAAGDFPDDFAAFGVEREYEAFGAFLVVSDVNQIVEDHRGLAAAMLADEGAQVATSRVRCRPDRGPGH